jgi:hypothetical protein
VIDGATADPIAAAKPERPKAAPKPKAKPPAQGDLF